MTYFIGVIVAILVLLTVISLHELGHMLIAKLFGVGVVEYAIGMGPALFSKRFKDTVYSVRLVPFGGYCAMYGEESMEAGDKGVSEEEKASATVQKPKFVLFGKKPEYKTDWTDDQKLLNKSWWKRLLIYFAGPFTNLLIGFVACLLMVSFFNAASVAVVTDLMPNHSAVEAGVQVGDIICGANNRDALTWTDYTSYIATHENVIERDGGYTLKVFRDGEYKSFWVTRNPEDNYIGITVKQEPVEMTWDNVWLYSVNSFRYMFRSVFDGFYMLSHGTAKMTDMSGVVGVTDLIAGSVEEAVADEDVVSPLAGVLSVAITMLGFLAVNIGLVNMIPFPALDGGRSVMCIFEGIFRRKIPEKVEYAINFAGMSLLMVLLVFTLFSDIHKLFLQF